ncbi:hypothetical protein O4328_41655 [Rhodococcus opacus]|uniref:Uncharacterized protein n=1 Tax=Rhodococcus opacus TaxID=37919 RepID=A0AAX3Y7V0_RHOOP|nr:hypothetical protein [Rhodococcus opacus]MCZ4590064.1 hypothetical protein [Rhodococcus opacus]WLF44579.1 hypothetical protein Q5707_21770 [Rhodococcus opacus]
MFACAIAVAIGAFRPVAWGIAPGDVAVIDLRDGFPTAVTVEQIENQAVTFYKSMMALLLRAAVLLLVAALVGSRAAGWLGVIVGIGTLVVFFWRLNDLVGEYLRTTTTPCSPIAGGCTSSAAA